jgi:putative DNA primase/helicase
LHQTYLTVEGHKAAVAQPRKARSLYKGALRGAAIRLYPAQDRLALAEGIETALSLRVAWPEYPVWSCISASGLAGVQIPATVAEVLIIADADHIGQHAAEKLADRLTAKGYTARILTPDTGDLNDFFRSASHD